MKVAILCGGLGTRLREETEFRPKPMVEIGGRPILWHIMKGYAHFGFNDFVLALGYKGHCIRDYFLQYKAHNTDITVSLGTGELTVHGESHSEDDWVVTLSETGAETLTGGRLKRLSSQLDSTFLATYGDGVSNVNLTELVSHHKKMGKLATVSAVRPSSRFGELRIENGIVTVFQEKPQTNEGWINGGFFVFEREVLELISGDDETLEQGLLTRLADSGQLAVYQHRGFWQCMDTAREMELLNESWRKGNAPWRVW